MLRVPVRLLLPKTSKRSWCFLQNTPNNALFTKNIKVIMMFFVNWKNGYKSLWAKQVAFCSCRRSTIITLRTRTTTIPTKATAEAITLILVLQALETTWEHTLPIMIAQGVCWEASSLCEADGAAEKAVMGIIILCVVGAYLLLPNVEGAEELVLLTCALSLSSWHLFMGN